MIFQADKKVFFDLFDAIDFDEFRQNLSSNAPSISIYFVQNAIALATEIDFLNKRNVSDYLTFDKYQIYLDYNDTIFIEYSNDDYENEDSLF